jgi:hypothetical protein
LLGELLNVFFRFEELTCRCVDFDAYVVAGLGRFLETLGVVAEQSEVGKEEVESLTESQREFPGGCEEEEVVDLR